MLPSQCEHCARRINYSCLAMSDPQKVWRKGRCWAYCDDPRRVAMELLDIARYYPTPYNQASYHAYVKSWGLEQCS